MNYPKILTTKMEHIFGHPKIWSPKVSDIQSFYFDFYSIHKKENFKQLFSRNFELGSRYAILIRVEFKDGEYRMAGTQIGFTLNSILFDQTLNALYDKVEERLKAFCEGYNVEFLDSVQILFVKVTTLPKLRLTNINQLVLPPEVSNIQDTRSKFHSNLLPLTPDTNYYGKLVRSNADIQKFLDIINEQGQILLRDEITIKDFDQIYIYQDKYIILNKKLKEDIYSRDVFDVKLGVFEGNFIDKILDKKTFSREYKSTNITIQNGKVDIIEVSKILPIISSKLYESTLERKDTLVANPFIGTFDIETFKDINSLGRVYAAGFTTFNQEPVLFYLDSKDITLNRDVLVECLDTMLVSKYNNYIFYVHNLDFEGPFILHRLKSINHDKGFDYYRMNLIFRDNLVLKLEITIDGSLTERNFAKPIVRKKPKDIKITFIDSSKLLKGSLADLCKAFGTSITKGFFPHKFVTRDTLNYKGITPIRAYWPDIENKREEYIKSYSSTWNLKEECLLYLRKDLLSLLEIMDLFNKYVSRKFDVQLTRCLTISRLSLNIFLKDYLGKFRIPIIKGNMYEDIKKGYYGGVTEVYKPYGNNLYYYDVNSLYPFVALNPMCGNQYKYIENFSDKGLDLSNLFGFFFCEIETKDNYLGLLPLRKPEGLLMPNGKWTGWYFSEELKFALKHNYKIKVIKGYDFIPENSVFSNYVGDLYKIKSTTTNSVERAVIKSLLNNLLGRFGMDITRPITEIVNREKLNELLTIHELNSYKEITPNDWLVSYDPKISKEKCLEFGYDYVKVLQNFSKKDKQNSEFNDVSIVISAAVTAYARIYMSQVKLNILNKGGNIYYTDTDSLVTNIPLDKTMVGNQIGQFKLEHRVQEGYFMSSKTYCLLLENGQTIIKAKGILNSSLTLEDFKKLYKGEIISGIKRSAITTLNKGSVIIEDQDTNLSIHNYTKREKVYDSYDKWIDTKALYIDDTLDSHLLNSSYQIEKPSQKKVRWKKIINNLYLLLVELGKFWVSLFLVCFMLDVVDFPVAPYLDSNDTNLNKGLDPSKLNLEEPMKFKNGVRSKDMFLTNNKKYPILQKIYIDYKDSLLQNLYEETWQNVITTHMIRERQFKSIESVVQYAKHSLLETLQKRNIRINMSDYMDIIQKIGENLSSERALIKIGSNGKENIRYNIPSKSYLQKYMNWVINPYINDDPGKMILKEERSLMDELQTVHNEYQYILNSMQSPIESKDIPRSLENSPMLSWPSFSPRIQEFEVLKEQIKSYNDRLGVLNENMKEVEELLSNSSVVPPLVTTDIDNILSLYDHSRNVSPSIGKQESPISSILTLYQEELVQSFKNEGLGINNNNKENVPDKVSR